MSNSSHNIISHHLNASNDFLSCPSNHHSDATNTTRSHSHVLSQTKHTSPSFLMNVLSLPRVPQCYTPHRHNSYQRCNTHINSISTIDIVPYVSTAGNFTQPKFTKTNKIYKHTPSTHPSPNT